MRLINADALKASLPEPDTSSQRWVYRTLCDFIDYEKREQVKEIVDSMMQSFDSIQSVGGYTDEI